MFDLPRKGDAAVLVGLDLGDPDAVESLEELAQLAASARLTPVAVITGKRERPGSGYLRRQRQGK